MFPFYLSFEHWYYDRDKIECIKVFLPLGLVFVYPEEHRENTLGNSVRRLEKNENSFFQVSDALKWRLKARSQD